MDGADLRFASEIVHAASGRNTDPSARPAAPVAVGARRAPKRLRAGEAAVASLLRDHARYAGLADTAGTDALPSEPFRYEASRNIQGLVPHLPDMFGTVVAAAPNSSNSMGISATQALDAAVAQWGEEGRLDDASAHVGSDGGLPLLRRWVRATVSPASNQTEWRRVDELAVKQMVQQSETASHLLHESTASIAESIAAAGVVGAPGLRFFTFSEEEYTALPPATLSSYVFDFESAQKLMDLYERYGNPVVVADRWGYSDAAGRRPYCQLETGNGEHDRVTSFQTSSPSPEAITAEYFRVTAGVMHQRRRRLHSLLMRAAPSPPCGGEEEGTTPADGKAAASKGKRQGVEISGSPANNMSGMGEHSALLAYLSKHPFLLDAPELADELAQGNEPSAPVVVTEKATAKPITPQQLLDRLTASTVPRYQEAEEVKRRNDLRVLLARESTLNVPYQRTSEEYLNLLPRVAQSLQKLHSILPAALPDEPEWMMADREGLPGHLDISEIRKWAKKRDALCNYVTAEPLPDVDPSLWESTRAQLAKVAQRQLRPASVPGESEDGSSTTAPSREGGLGNAHSIVPYCATLREALVDVPVHCERLRLTAQAGWILPAVRPQILPTVVKPTTNGVGSSSVPLVPASSEISGSTAPTAAIADDDSDRDTFFSTEEVNGTPYQFLKRVAQSGMCNRAYSMLSEAVLLSLPSTIPRLHREVEQELEKHLWDHDVALMDVGPDVQRLTASVREFLTMNCVLRRYAAKVENMLDVSHKISSDITEAIARAKSSLA